jgi:hypothetical protein
VAHADGERETWTSPVGSQPGSAWVTGR